MNKKHWVTLSLASYAHTSEAASALVDFLEAGDRFVAEHSTLPRQMTLVQYGRYDKPHRVCVHAPGLAPPRLGRCGATLRPRRRVRLERVHQQGSPAIKWRLWRNEQRRLQTLGESHVAP